MILGILEKSTSNNNSEKNEKNDRNEKNILNNMNEKNSANYDSIYDVNDDDSNSEKVIYIGDRSILIDTEKNEKEKRNKKIIGSDGFYNKNYIENNKKNHAGNSDYYENAYKEVCVMCINAFLYLYIIIIVIIFM